MKTEKGRLRQNRGGSTSPCHMEIAPGSEQLSPPTWIPSIAQLAVASRVIARWLAWEEESLELFHQYAQRFCKSPGSNVYLSVLEDALKLRGLTLEQFKSEAKTAAALFSR